MNDFGKVQFESKTYFLKDYAVFTSRCLPHPYQDTHFEMSCIAKDYKGKQFVVYWIFENDEEKLLEDYDFNNVDRVEEYDDER